MTADRCPQHQPGSPDESLAYLCDDCVFPYNHYDPPESQDLPYEPRKYDLVYIEGFGMTEMPF